MQIHIYAFDVDIILCICTIHYTRFTDKCASACTNIHAHSHAYKLLADYISHAQCIASAIVLAPLLAALPDACSQRSASNLPLAAYRRLRYTDSCLRFLLNTGSARRA